MDGSPLYFKNQNNELLAEDGSVYPIVDGRIFDLLDTRLVDEYALDEIETFEKLPISDDCYFRPEIFDHALNFLSPYLISNNIPKVCVEIGAGQGFFANSVINYFDDRGGFVADLSFRHLKLTDPKPQPIRCDVRQYYLPPSSIGLAAFWVSLHHFEDNDLNHAFARTSEITAPGGLLLAFEPNGDFFPRRLFYHTPLAKLVYFDDKEKPCYPDKVTQVAEKNGFTHLKSIGVNPSYSVEFLKNFRLWQMFHMATYALHMFDTISTELPIGLGSYMLSVFRKND